MPQLTLAKGTPAYPATCSMAGRVPYASHRLVPTASSSAIFPNMRGTETVALVARCRVVVTYKPRSISILAGFQRRQLSIQSGSDRLQVRAFPGLDESRISLICIQQSSGPGIISDHLYSQSISGGYCIIFTISPMSEISIASLHSGNPGPQAN